MKMAGLGLLVCMAGIQSQASIVYEGFDYTVGSTAAGQGTGDGWDGTWTGGDSAIDDGLSLGSVSGSGGALQRPSRSGNAATSRAISAASQTALLADGSTMYFSVMMAPTGNGANGYALNSYGTIVLGDTALTGGSGNSAAPMGAGGNAIGVGFGSSVGTADTSDFANMTVQGVTYSGGTASTSAKTTTGEATLMIVGKVDWAADGSDDIVSLYNVTDPTAALPEAFSTMTVDLDQSAFNVVSIGDAQTSVFDEIRFDTGPENVILISSGGTTNDNGGTTVTNMVTQPVLQVVPAHTSLNVAATFSNTNTFPFLLQFASNLTDNAWSNLDSAFVTNTSWVMPTEPTKGFYRTKKQPNIVFVFADQMRACSLGAMGNTEVITPELDRLATEGMMLTQAISSQPVCTPYRAQLLSGRYGHTTGVVHNDIRLPDDELLLPTILKDNGYTTGYIGKWHLAGNRSNPVDATSRRDWDYWAVRNCSHEHDYVQYWVDDATSATTVPDAWEPTVQTDLAIDFINAHTNEPFCLMVSMGPPHNPYAAPDEYLTLYDDVTITPRPNVPASKLSYATNNCLQYYAMITSIDENMGRLDAAIQAAGLEDDTIFVFTSDHGDMLGSLGQLLKQRPWEESINIPFIIRYPRGIESGQQPDWLFSSIDVMPTLLGLCRIDVPANLQGIDYSSTFTGTSNQERDAVYLFNVLDGAGPDVDWRGIRTKQWTYAYHEGGDWVLYNLENDPYQLNNLVNNAEYAQVKAALASQLEEMRVELGDDTVLVGDTPSAIVLP